MFLVTSFYSFKALGLEGALQLKQKLKQTCDELQIIGLAIIAPEGVNCTLVGGEQNARSFQAWIRNELSTQIHFKDSFCAEMPFRRLRVELRDEIVTLNTGVTPLEEEHMGYLSPDEWHEALSNNTGLVLDVRNDYEVKLGRFTGAVDPQLKVFSEFSNYVAASQIPKDTPIYMYCTGGIRCEKAALEMRKQGFHSVFQLEGGILNYLETHPDGHYQGECFVFDHRVAVDKNLEPSKRYRLCPLCGDPGEEKISCQLCSKETVLCTSCAEMGACSKNCRYHLFGESNASKG